MPWAWPPWSIMEILLTLEVTGPWHLLENPPSPKRQLVEPPSSAHHRSYSWALSEELHHTGNYTTLEITPPFFLTIIPQGQKTDFMHPCSSRASYGISTWHMLDALGWPSLNPPPFYLPSYAHWSELENYREECPAKRAGKGDRTDCYGKGDTP